MASPFQEETKVNIKFKCHDTCSEQSDVGAQCSDVLCLYEQGCHSLNLNCFQCAVCLTELLLFSGK
jgi:hypothetical protein